MPSGGSRPKAGVQGGSRPKAEKTERGVKAEGRKRGGSRPKAERGKSGARPKRLGIQRQGRRPEARRARTKAETRGGIKAQGRRATVCQGLRARIDTPRVARWPQCDCGFLWPAFRRIAVRIRIISVDSCISGLTLPCGASSHAAIRRSQSRASRPSLRAIEFFATKSALLCATSASSRFAPIDVAASSS